MYKKTWQVRTDILRIISKVDVQESSILEYIGISWKSSSISLYYFAKYYLLFWLILLSLPSRERGLKSDDPQDYGYISDVAPFAGAWIEILDSTSILIESSVAPFAGAWIEMLLH